MDRVKECKLARIVIVMIEWKRSCRSSIKILLPKAPRKDTHNGEYSSLEVRLGKEE